MSSQLRQFTGFSRLLHWTMAAMVLAMLGIGVTMVAAAASHLAAQPDAVRGAAEGAHRPHVLLFPDVPRPLRGGPVSHADRAGPGSGADGAVERAAARGRARRVGPDGTRRRR